MALAVTIVVGNPKPRSRTRLVAESVVSTLFEAGTFNLQVIDLADHVDEVFRWPSEQMSAIVEQVVASDLAVFASPTYKATYTGLLKAFLDRFPTSGLRGVTVLPVMTGGSPGHSMGLDVNLAPLLAELGATMPTRGLYFVTEEMDELSRATEEAAREFASAVTRLAGLCPYLDLNVTPAGRVDSNGP